MRIMADIAVEKVWLSKSTYTFRSERMEVEVLTVLRSPCGRGAAANRYYYTAIIKQPERMHPDAGFSGVGQRVGVIRSINPSWKPPVFESGKNVYEVTA